MSNSSSQDSHAEPKQNFFPLILVWDHGTGTLLHFQGLLSLFLAAGRDQEVFHPQCSVLTQADGGRRYPEVKPFLIP